MKRTKAVLIWAGLLTAIAVPIMAAAASPLIAFRQSIYVAAGMAGVVAMCLLLVQPLLVAGDLPGLAGANGRRVHRWIGAGLVLAVLAHVTGLWLTSPPDVVDALLFVSPTQFSVWGVVAMWAVFAAAALAAWRGRIGLKLPTWRRAHVALAIIVVLGSVVHALLIEGTMEPISKALLCLLVLGATAKTIVGRRIFARNPRRG